MSAEGPQTLLEAVRHFSDLDVCHEYMRGVKWPDGNIICPKCGGNVIGVIASRRSMRDYFAAHALVGYAANDSVMDKAIDCWQGNGGLRPACIAEFLAGLAYEVADKMLAERIKRPPTERKPTPIKAKQTRKTKRK